VAASSCVIETPTVRPTADERSRDTKVDTKVDTKHKTCFTVAPSQIHSVQNSVRKKHCKI
jgi:hypothetical protein